MVTCKDCIHDGVCIWTQVDSKNKKVCKDFKNKADYIDLINRQKAEIERYLHSIKLLEKDVSVAKSEAIKEFGIFLINRSKNGVINTMDIPDYVIEMKERF